MAQRSLVPRSMMNLPMMRFPYFWDLDEETENMNWLSNTGLNISEDDNNVYIQADLPGMRREDIELIMDKGMLSIKGSRFQEEKEKDKEKNLKFHSKTMSSSFFYRVAIPGQIDESQEPKAIYTDGVLNITLKKTKQGQSKRIQIQK